MSKYSQFTEQKKEKMRQAHQKWASKNPRTKYYQEYDAKRDLSYKLYRSARQRALNNDLIFTITREDIKVPCNCPICDVKMKPSNKGGGSSISPTLDKVIPEKGYVKGNIAVICKLCNSTKGSGSAEIHRKIADYIDRHT